MIQVTHDQAHTACASTAFANQLSRFEFDSIQALLTASRDIWFNQLNAFDWFEAFRGHPAIGAKASQHHGTDEARAASTKLSAGEQSTAVATLTADKASALEAWNAKYQARFGHVFLIFAAGRTSDDILGELQRRYNNPVHIELYNAAQEQQKITEKRLMDMLGVAPAETMQPAHVAPTQTTQAVAGATPVPIVSPTTRLASVSRHITGTSTSGRKEVGVGGITSHMLDTCQGRPASAVTIRLERDGPGGYTVVSSAVTNEQGRATLVDNGQQIAAGRYRVWFDLSGYYARCRRDSPEFFTAASPFFPEASVVFDVSEEQSARWDHFHIPLTWGGPFGYSTYRGS